MGALDTILGIVNAAYLLPFTLTSESVVVGPAYASNFWPGANSAVDIDGTGEGGYDGVFTVYYNRFDLSTLVTGLEFYVTNETTLDDVRWAIAEYLTAFPEELTFDVDTMPVMMPGDTVVINLLGIDGSLAYYGSVPVTLIYEGTLPNGARIFESGEVRLMEDGSIRILE